ncbi:hypothetical protein LTR22_028283 [Elasticomyces elasticus]|nr:hypothetical protein LTR22_028283 [Elasticomyces elasticus]
MRSEVQMAAAMVIRKNINKDDAAQDPDGATENTIQIIGIVRLARLEKLTKLTAEQKTSGLVMSTTIWLTIGDDAV